MPLAPHRWQALAPPAANVEVALLINGYIRTTEMAARGLSIHVATQGNSRGTLDARLNDPTSDPVTEQRVMAFQGTQQLFDGFIRSTEIDEYKVGSHKFAGFTAQDDGPSGLLPTAAPFGLSDNPNGTTTFGYVNLRKLTRTTEGGSVKTSYQVVYKGYGLWSNMLVQVTSTLLGLSATELLIVDASVSWEYQTVPVFTFELGQPLVHLSELVKDPVLAPGAITSTQISDGAISTPKLAADAVIANVANIGGTVLIDAAGIRVTGGAVTVTNPTGTVIIDGTSDIFRISATGTQSVSPGAAAVVSTLVTLTALGAQTQPPAHLVTLSDSLAVTAFRYSNPMLDAISVARFVAATSGGAVTTRVAIPDVAVYGTTYLDGSNVPVFRLTCANATAAGITRYGRYYILSQGAL